MKEKNKYLLISSFFVIFLGVFAAGFCVGKTQKTRIIHVNFEYTEQENGERIHKYDFLGPVMSDYIEDLSNELEIDPDICVAHLLTENPELNWGAIHKNTNGTLDLGGFQLNDKYLYTDFLPDYWDMDIDFDPFNPKQNTFIALHHIRYLNEKLKVQEDAIAAYNCGIYAVMNNKIPESTTIYAKQVLNTYTLLKSREN